MKKPYMPKQDRVNPCAVCGWGKHMGIHTYKKESWTKNPKGPHEYVQKGQQP